MLKKYIISFCVFIFSFIIMFTNHDSTDISFPIHSSYYISSDYGYRNLGNVHFHNGIDIPKPIGTPVYPISNGVISKIDFSSSYGNYMIITYSNGYKTLYGHLSNNYEVNVNKKVSSNFLNSIEWHP